MGRTGVNVRKLIGLLLTLNLGVLLAGLALQYWPLAHPDAVFNAEKIRLLDVPTQATSTQVSEPPRATAPEPAEAKPAPKDQAVARCMQWTSLDAEGWLVVEKHLAQAGIASGAYDIKLDMKLGWWVFLPPQKTTLEAQVMIEEIDRLGIKEYALVRGGSMRNAVSLGAFAHLAQARTHATRLSRAGIDDVQFAPRPGAGVARLSVESTVADGMLKKLQTDWPKGMQPEACAN